MARSQKEGPRRGCRGRLSKRRGPARASPCAEPAKPWRSSKTSQPKASFAPAAEWEGGGPARAPPSLSCDSIISLEASFFERCPFVHLESVTSRLLFLVPSLSKVHLIENGYNILERYYPPGTYQSYSETSVPMFLLYPTPFKGLLGSNICADSL